MQKDHEALIIDLPPDDITVGHDPDGLPKTIPLEKFSEPKPKPRESAPKLDDAIAQVKRERDEAIAAKARENADLQARLVDERKTREAAEGQRDSAQDNGLRAHWEAVNSHKSQIESAMAATENEAASAERDYAAAREAGDVKAETAASRRMAKAEAALIQLQYGKDGAEAEIEKAKAIIIEARTKAVEPKKDKAEKAEKAENVEKTESKLTPEQWIAQWPKKTTGKWLTDHKDYVTDPDKHKDLLAFAKEWADDYGAGTLHTPDFIKALNEKFDTSEEPDMEEEEEVAEVEVKEKPAKKVTASAPVSRGNSNFYSSKNPNGAKVWLHPKLAAEAKALNMEPKEYAENVKVGIKKGKLPKNYLDPDYDHENSGNR